jgi:uncharacterized protein (DUF2235 family)
MQKKLAVFCDGTWNQASLERTNVVKLFEAALTEDAPVDQSTPRSPQLAYYVRGVGTRHEEKYRGGAFGYGISDNIRDAYSFIVANFEPGDQIFLFGFSRGAFTARSIAGFIRNLGVLRRDQLHRVDYAFEKYRDKSVEWAPDGPQAVCFRKNYSHPDESIEFIGVWDTVGALGAPYGLITGWIVDKIFKCSFHGTKLSSWVQNAYHALAVDERRWPFRPTLWELSDAHRQRNEEALKAGKIPRYEQKWFPGVHADVGGGCGDSTGLSDLALEWMADRARHHGLNIDLNILNKDPNPDAPPEFKPDIRAKPHDSQTPYYRTLTRTFIFYPGKLALVRRFVFPESVRDLVDNVTPEGDYVRKVDAINENIDVPTRKKADDPDYRPPNIA